MTYNVFVGFKNDDKRHDRAMAWIAEQKPDVVALQELNGYTEAKLEEDARTLGAFTRLVAQSEIGFSSWNHIAQGV